MTNTIDPKKGEKVLEIGNRLGLSIGISVASTYNVYTIEIIKPLADRTRATYGRIDRGRLQRIQRRSARRTQTAITAGKKSLPSTRSSSPAGIDHIPPPLLQQLKPNGVMVIPVGPPGAQRGAEGRQDAGGRRLHHRRALRHLRRQDRALRAFHQARRRFD